MTMASLLGYFEKVVGSAEYPAEVCFFHCLRACAAWRVYRETAEASRRQGAVALSTSGHPRSVSSAHNGTALHLDRLHRTAGSATGRVNTDDHDGGDDTDATTTSINKTSNLSGTSIGNTGGERDVSVAGRTDGHSFVLPYDAIAAYLCFGYGGGTLRDLFAGDPVTFLTSDKIPTHWCVAWALVNLTPGDRVYRALQQPLSVLRVVSVVFDAIDTATAVSNSVEKGYARFPKSAAGPVMLGLLVGIGGAAFRWAEARSRGEGNGVGELVSPTRVSRRTLLFVLIHILIRRRGGAERARLCITAFHVAYTLAEEISGKSTDWTLPLAHYPSIAALIAAVTIGAASTIGRGGVQQVPS